VAFPLISLWFDNLEGQNGHHVSTLRQSQKGVEMSKAANVIPNPPGMLTTSPGFTEIRATAISGTPLITGMQHMGDLVDSLILAASDGKIYQDSANPPAEITGGTAHTSGGDNLARFEITNDVLLIVNQERDVVRQLTSGLTLTDLSGTPPQGLDVKLFGRRVHMFSPDVSGTIHRHISSFTSSDDSNTAWTAPTTTNFINYGRPGEKLNIKGAEIFKDHMMVFSADKIFPVFQTPSAELPFSFQNPIMNEEGGGPPIIHAVVKANDHLYWISENMDVKSMDASGEIRSIGFAAQPFLRGLNDSRRDVTVGAWEPKFRLIVWAVSDGSDTANADLLMLHVDTGQFFFRTISRNAFVNRVVSGEIRLVGGGNAGKIYNEFTGTTGDLDDASSAIDADIQGPRHHLGLPGVVKKGVIMAVELDPIGSETVTIQGNVDDETAFTTLDTTIAVSGTDIITKYFKLNPFDRFQPRFRDATSGEQYRVIRYGFSRPTSTYSAHT